MSTRLNLTARQLQICRLRYCDGLSPAAIARKTGVSRTAVYAMLARARRRANPQGSPTWHVPLRRVYPVSLSDWRFL